MNSKANYVPQNLPSSNSLKITIEKVSFPIKKGDLNHRYVTNCQRVSIPCVIIDVPLMKYIITISFSLWMSPETNRNSMSHSELLHAQDPHRLDPSCFIGHVELLVPGAHAEGGQGVPDAWWLSRCSWCLLLVVPLVFGFSPVRCIHLWDLLLPLAQLSHKKS